MLNKINNWIDNLNRTYSEQKISCRQFLQPFAAFYSEAFLDNASYVVVDKIPKPEFPELSEMGLGDFIDMPASAITYKDTYYILVQSAESMRIHFHELVHVAQWQLLGAQGFISRYIQEIQQFGYAQAPLEKMAYALDGHFAQGGESIVVPNYVAKQLSF
ncbi:hypothetical protein [Aliikangiella maris]|uniref:Uncharacterized protein n=2 Tax=Aliikangiella maris TaxID=3162458 RepID=A0ABV3MTN0_9GAMM